ncbi:AAR2 protein-domain-containing protein [Mariannaea sp. PMI_226]|nr:AAR2 protein-domain-containing protein [Mariannaea sp. PMI_226]
MEGNINNASPLPYRIPQLTKSNSNASVGSSSARSVKVLGAHPLGTLRMHEQASPSPMHEDDDDDDDDDDLGPPPLDPPAGKELQQGDTSKILSDNNRRSPIQSPALRHGMGGGDVVLVLDLPELFTVGYDSISFTARHFGGVRDIPPGPHFFWVAHMNGLSARCGFWIDTTNTNTVHVFQWDRFNEILTQSARAEALIQVENLESFHSKLVPYSDPSATNAVQGSLTKSASERNLEIWRQLTSRISEALLTRVIRQPLDNWMVHTGDRVNGSILDAAEMRLDKSLSNVMLKTRELYFTFDQQSKSYSTAQTGIERTQLATDSTHYLISTIEKARGALAADDIIGEFQFAFIVGVHLGNDSCIQQWWHMLLQIFLRAYLLPVRHPVLTSDFLRTLTAHLSYSSSWLDGSILDQAQSQSRELRLALTVYKRRLDEMLLALSNQATAEQLTVSTSFAGLEATVVSELDWDLRGEFLRRGNVMMEDGEQVELETADLEAEDERGEWAPAVVDLDETGRQRDLVSWRD